MKQGMTLDELGEEIARQSAAKLDYKADTRKLEMLPAQVPLLQIHGLQDENLAYTITDYAHRQIGTRLGIPATYYDSMRTQAPGLLTTNVNYWFQGKPERRLIRTLDGNVRAFLSDAYRLIDNFDVMTTVMPILRAAGNVTIRSCDLTEKKMYLKVVYPDLEREVKTGDPVRFGAVISNSEVGAGSVSVAPFCERLVCTNGMIVMDLAKRKYHIGRVSESDEDVSIFKGDTLQADDKAFVLKLRDVIQASLEEASIENQLAKMRLAAGITVSATGGEAIDAVEVVAKKVLLTESEKKSFMASLLGGGDFSGWGYANAVTATAELCDSYDRATELEMIGGEMIGWSAKQWEATFAK